MAVNLTSSSSKSLATLPSQIIIKHDGHSEGHLNCVGIRHGWTRTFSIPSEELESLDYAHLESYLELSTLKIRNLHLRIFVEHPPNSGTFAKVRFWKDDGSLQSVLVKDFFMNRRAMGEVTKFEVRDGVDRTTADMESLRTVGSRLVPLGLQRTASARGWFGSTKSAGTATDNPFADGSEVADTKVTRRKSFFDFFRSAKPDSPGRTEAEQEEEELRKRGWLPPGMRRKKSLKSQLSDSSSPFFSSGGSRRRQRERDNETATEAEPEAEDEFIEVDGDSTALENRRPQKPWSRFKGSKDTDKKNKQKGKTVEFIRSAEDAFPKKAPATPPKNASDVD